MNDKKIIEELEEKRELTRCGCKDCLASRNFALEAMRIARQDERLGYEIKCKFSCYWKHQCKMAWHLNKVCKELFRRDEKIIRSVTLTKKDRKELAERLKDPTLYQKGLFAVPVDAFEVVRIVEQFYEEKKEKARVGSRSSSGRRG